MSQYLHRLRTQMREAVSKGYVPTTTNPDKLTASVLVMTCVKKFHEGYYGALLDKKMTEGRALRTSDRAAYDNAMQTFEGLLTDLQGLRDRRMVEALTGTDLAYGIAAARDASRRERLAPFESDLLALALQRARTVENLKPVRTRDGVRLADRFLQMRQESTNVAYTSWTGATEMYEVNNWELGLEFTWEMLVNDEFGELQDAMYELGQAAARTRARSVIDAIRARIPRLELPDQALGPIIENIKAIRAHLANQSVNGQVVSRALSDIYVPHLWRSELDVSLESSTVAVVGATPSGDGRFVGTQNSVYRAARPHSEAILTEAAPSDPNHSVKDYIAVDASRRPLEFATLRGFEGGPVTLTKVADTVEFDHGTFDNSLFSVKIKDVHGVGISDATALILVAGDA